MLKTVLFLFIILSLGWSESQARPRGGSSYRPSRGNLVTLHCLQIANESREKLLERCKSELSRVYQSEGCLPKTPLDVQCTSPADIKTGIGCDMVSVNCFTLQGTEQSRCMGVGFGAPIKLTLEGGLKTFNLCKSLNPPAVPNEGGESNPTGNADR